MNDKSWEWHFPMAAVSLGVILIGLSQIIGNYGRTQQLAELNKRVAALETQLAELRARPVVGALPPKPDERVYIPGVGTVTVTRP